MELSSLAQTLLDRMRESPNRLHYDTDVLGSMFRLTDLERLDTAYQQLETEGLIERSGAIISFFGQPKYIYRLSPKGQALVESRS